jgi:hypothetical protein
MHPQRLFAACFLLLLAPAALAAAPAATGRIEITPFAGYRLEGDFDDPDGDFIDLGEDARVDEGNVYGVAVDIPLAYNWKLQLLANRQESAFIADQGLLSPPRELGDLTLTMVHAGFAYEWGGGQVRPYVSLTGGITRLDPEFSGLDAEDRLSGSFGGGVKIFFSEHLGLRLEGRGFWTALDEDEFDDRDRHRRYDTEAGLYQAEATAGLIFAF